MPLVPGPAVTFPLNRPCNLRTLHPLVRDLACSILAQQDEIEALDQRDTSLQNQIDSLDTQINNISVASCHDGIVDGVGALTNTHQTVQLAVAGGARSICVTADVTETVPADAGGDNVCIELFRNSVVTVTVDSYLTNGNYNIRGCVENTVPTTPGPSLEFAIAGLSNTFATATASVSLQNLRVFSSVGNTRLILNAGASAVGTVIDTCTFLGTGGVPLSWEISVSSPVTFVNNTIGAPAPNAFFFTGYDSILAVVISNNNMQNVTVSGTTITDLSISKNIINTLTLNNDVTATTISDNVMSTLSASGLIDSTISGNTTTDTAAGYSFGQVTHSTITGNHTGTMTFAGDVARGTITGNTLESVGSADFNFQSSLSFSTVTGNVLASLIPARILVGNASTNTTISGNNLLSNGGGVTADASMTLTGNMNYFTITGNVLNGISASVAANNTDIRFTEQAIDCTITGNTIRREAGGTPATSGRIVSNGFFRCTISNNRTSGNIAETTTGDGASFTGNVCNRILLVTAVGNYAFTGNHTTSTTMGEGINCTTTSGTNVLVGNRLEAAGAQTAAFGGGDIIASNRVGP